ncbi:MAG: hypothetical protein GXX93_06355 [Anaerolineae bacterium]|nr:hypothetical protein [Anaerolineae bacterium]
MDESDWGGNRARTGARAPWLCYTLAVSSRSKLLSLLLVLTLTLGSGAPAPARAQDDAVSSLMDSLTAREKVGQLFLVTFHGDQAGRSTDIANLIQEYRIGGVILSAERGNVDNSRDAAGQTRRLVSQLQTLALETKAPTPPPRNLPEDVDRPRGASTATPTPMYGPDVHAIPLLIGVEQDGDGYPYTALRTGLTELPSAMTVGATWDAANAFTVGNIVGTELAALGVNLLLGPSVDVLQRARPGMPGDIGVRAFGGDPYWVGEMARAYVSGVHQGSDGMVLSIAKHFPGLGSSDRKATEEVATVQKSLQELRQMELAPFFAVTNAGSGGRATMVDGLMTSPLIRYRGFQGNIRQLTRPIGLDSDGLTALMALPEFETWRSNGLLVSGPLGLPAVRKFYEAQGRSFPHRSIAQEALLAGNDLIYVADFAATDDWEEQVANIEDAIGHFAAQYERDAAFRGRVDDALERVLRLKLQLFPDFSLDAVLARPELPLPNTEAVLEIGAAAATLIYPEAAELDERLPAGPARGESVLVVTDVREVQECAACVPFDSIPVASFQETVLRLYGSAGAELVADDDISSADFRSLDELLAAEAAEQVPSPEQQDLADRLQDADWIVFLMQDVDVDEHPYSDALRLFLKQRSDWMRDKRLVVFCLNGPYFLDTTEVSKLTAYFALYSKGPASLEAAARLLFRELEADGLPPVDVQAVSYELITRLEPDPNGVLGLEIIGEPPDPSGEERAVRQGSTITVRTGVIRDRNGSIVPDGTPVEFRLYYRSESLELPRQRATTVAGVAQTSIQLDRSGDLEVSATTDTRSPSVTLVITIRGDEPVTFATIVPPTPTPRPSPTPRPTPMPQATESSTEGPGASSLEPGQIVRRAPWLGAGLLWWSLAGVLAANLTLHIAFRRQARTAEARVRLTLWSLVLGLSVYCALVVGLVEVPLFMACGPGWAAFAVSGLAAALAWLSLLTGRAPRASSSG